MSYNKEESQEKVTARDVIAEEFDQLAKRQYLVRRGRNNRLLVRPILEMVFDDGPKQHDLSYGLPGQSLLENKNYSSRRIYGVGQNFY